MILYLHHYGVSIYFGESIEKISDNIKEVKPITQLFQAYWKVYDKIFKAELTGIKKEIVLLGNWIGISLWTLWCQWFMVWNAT
jgi:long-chain acyl-CoA synthetase